MEVDRADEKMASVVIKTPQGIEKKGYKDRFIGLLLSAFWAYYKTSVYLGIYREQKKWTCKWA